MYQMSIQVTHFLVTPNLNLFILGKKMHDLFFNFFSKAYIKVVVVNEI